MHKSLLNRYGTSRLATLMLIAAVTTLAGCNACNKKVSEDERTVNVLNKVGSDCSFQPANGQQSVSVEVKGTSTNNSGNTWTPPPFQSVAASAYTVKVPSQGTYKITITATETAGTTTCQPCSSVCGPMVTPFPKWTGSDSFTAPANTLNVEISIPSSPTKSDCGCQ